MSSSRPWNLQDQENAVAEGIHGNKQARSCPAGHAVSKHALLHESHARCAAGLAIQGLPSLSVNTTWDCIPCLNDA